MKVSKALEPVPPRRPRTPPGRRCCKRRSGGRASRRAGAVHRDDVDLAGDDVERVIIEVVVLADGAALGRAGRDRLEIGSSVSAPLRVRLIVPCRARARSRRTGVSVIQHKITPVMFTLTGATKSAERPAHRNRGAAAASGARRNDAAPNSQSLKFIPPRERDSRSGSAY